MPILFRKKDEKKSLMHIFGKSIIIMVAFVSRNEIVNFSFLLVIFKMLLNYWVYGFFYHVLESAEDKIVWGQKFRIKFWELLKKYFRFFLLLKTCKINFLDLIKLNFFSQNLFRSLIRKKVLTWHQKYF